MAVKDDIEINKISSLMRSFGWEMYESKLQAGYITVGIRRPREEEKEETTSTKTSTPTGEAITTNPD